MVYHYTTDVTKEKRHHDKECYRAMIHHNLFPFKVKLLSGLQDTFITLQSYEVRKPLSQDLNLHLYLVGHLHKS